MLSSAYRFGKMRCDFCVGEEFNFFPIILLNRVRFFQQINGCFVIVLKVSTKIY